MHSAALEGRGLMGSRGRGRVPVVRVEGEGTADPATGLGVHTEGHSAHEGQWRWLGARDLVNAVVHLVARLLGACVALLTTPT